MFRIIFYETKDGKIPVEEFLNQLDWKTKAKFVGLIKILEEKGNMLREPYSKKIDDDIFELRCIQGNNTSRILYFFIKDGYIVLTNGFIKKTNKTPKNEIRLANKYRNDYLERMK